MNLLVYCNSLSHYLINFICSLNEQLSLSLTEQGPCTDKLEAHSQSNHDNNIKNGLQVSQAKLTQRWKRPLRHLDSQSEFPQLRNIFAIHFTN